MTNSLNNATGQAQGSGHSILRTSKSSIMPQSIASRSSSITSTSVLLNTGIAGQDHLPKTQRTSHPPSLLLQKRFRLPWLDGNSNSTQLPGSYDIDIHTSLGPGSTSESKNPPVKREEISHRSSPIKHSESTPSLSNVTHKEPRQRTWSASSLACRPGVPTAPVSLMPGRWPTVVGQLQYTPSTYSSEPPSDHDMPSYLPRRDPVSYENLVVMPVDSPPAGPPRSGLWPMVPLSETDIPSRLSSLSFKAPSNRAASYVRGARSAYELSRGSSPSSIGRYTDGTISRKPTVRSSATQARLDRAATDRQLRSPDVSPKSSAPPYPTSSSTGRSSSQDPRSLERAVTGLQDLMHEALSVAAEAAQSNQSHEVAERLNEATLALKKANNVHGRMTEPLRISDPEIGGRPSSDDYMTGSDSEAFVESDTSSIGSNRRYGTERGAPNAYIMSRSAVTNDPAAARYSATAPISTRDTTGDRVPPSDNVFRPARISQPSLNSPYIKDGRRPESLRGSVDVSRLGVPHFSSPGDKSIAQTPPTMYSQPSASSGATAWAYVKRVPGRRDLRDESSSQHFPDVSSEDARTVIAPAPIRASTQDQMKFLSRNGPAEVPNSVRISLPEVPRERTLRPVRSQPNTTSRAVNSPAQEYSHISHEGPRQRHGPHVDVSRLFESQYYKLPDKDRDGVNGQGPEETRYGVSSQMMAANTSLRHPRRNHISLGDDQTFRLHKYRRQPIAREWSSIRKRSTAAIACLNTALIGLTAGIYVRSEFGMVS